MWSDKKYKKYYDNAQLEKSIKKRRKRIFFLDGPTRCGKTNFLKHLKSDNVVIISFQILLEEMLKELLRDDNYRECFETLDQRLNCAILCLEDIDISLKGKIYTQRITADLFDCLSEGRKIIITGIQIEKRCGELLSSLGKEKFDYFRFSEHTVGK